MDIVPDGWYTAFRIQDSAFSRYLLPTAIMESGARRQGFNRRIWKKVTAVHSFVKNLWYDESGEALPAMASSEGGLVMLWAELRHGI